MYSVALLWKKELVVNFCIQFNLYSLVAVETNELYCTIYFVLSPVGLVDEQQKVRTITALALAALAEAATPYGIESFDSVLKPLWKGIRQHRGKVRLIVLCLITGIICTCICTSIILHVYLVTFAMVKFFDFYLKHFKFAHLSILCTRN